MSFNLITSDQPPVTIQVARNALVSYCRVFADMISIESSSAPSDNTIPMTETEQELKPFCALISSQEYGFDTELQKLSEQDWESVARLADKYDSLAIRKAVEAKAWQVEAQQGSAAFAFTLATFTNNRELIKTTAKRAVRIRNLERPDFRAGHEWKDRLAAWRTVHSSNCFSLLRNAHAVCPECGCHSESCQTHHSLMWPLFLSTLLHEFDLCASPPFPLDSVEKLIARSRLCDELKNGYRAASRTIQNKLSRWPEFPVDGVSFESMRDDLNYNYV